MRVGAVRNASCGCRAFLPSQPRLLASCRRARVPKCLSFAGFEGIYVARARKVRQFGVGEGSQRGGREMGAGALHRTVGGRPSGSGCGNVGATVAAR